MKNLLLFEWKKNVKRIHFFIIVLSVFFSCMLFFVFNHFENNKQIETNKQTYSKNIQAIEHVQDTIGAQLPEVELKKNQQMLDKQKQQRQIMDKGSDKEQLTSKIEKWNSDVIDQEKLIGVESSTSLPQVVKELTTQEYTLLLEKKVKPAYPLNSVIPETILSDFDKGDWQQYEQVNTKRKYDQGWLMLYAFFKSDMPFVAFLLIVFLFGSSVTLEYNKQHQHSRFLQIQGITYFPLLASKLITSLVSILLLLGTGLLAVLVSAYFFSDIGSLDYPILTYFFPSSLAPITYRWSTLGMYLVQAMSLFLLCSIFILVFCYVLGQFFKSELLSWLFGFTMIGISYIAPAKSWNPLYYFHIHEVVSGMGAYAANEESLTTQSGFLSVGIVLIVLFILGDFLNRRGRKYFFL